jgi:hypothetical protein
MNVFFITVIFLFDIEVFEITYLFTNIYNDTKTHCNKVRMFSETSSDCFHLVCMLVVFL